MNVNLIKLTVTASNFSSEKGFQLSPLKAKDNYQPNTIYSFVMQTCFFFGLDNVLFTVIVYNATSEDIKSWAYCIIKI